MRWQWEGWIPQIRKTWLWDARCALESLGYGVISADPVGQYCVTGPTCEWMGELGTCIEAVEDCVAHWCAEHPKEAETDAERA